MSRFILFVFIQIPDSKYNNNVDDNNVKTFLSRPSIMLQFAILRDLVQMFTFAWCLKSVIVFFLIICKKEQNYICLPPYQNMGEHDQELPQSHTADQLILV